MLETTHQWCLLHCPLDIFGRMQCQLFNLTRHRECRWRYRTLVTRCSQLPYTITFFPILHTSTCTPPPCTLQTYTMVSPPQHDPHLHLCKHISKQMCWLQWPHISQHTKTALLDSGATSHFNKPSNGLPIIGPSNKTVAIACNVRSSCQYICIRAPTNNAIVYSDMPHMHYTYIPPTHYSVWVTRLTMASYHFPWRCQGSHGPWPQQHHHCQQKACHSPRCWDENGLLCVPLINSLSIPHKSTSHLQHVQPALNGAYHPIPPCRPQISNQTLLVLSNPQQQSHHVSWTHSSQCGKSLP